MANEPKMIEEWTDCTSLFREGTQELAIGELLHHECFGLFEAMSAIEIMDPKMDSGMMCNRNIQQQILFQKDLEIKQIKLDGLTNGEVISILDETLASFVTWLDGYSLAQTVFHNLYIQQPTKIDNRLIRTFSFLVYNLIDAVKSIIQKASIFEEEDFQPSKYGFKLNDGQLMPNEILDMFKEMEENFFLRNRDEIVQGTGTGPATITSLTTTSTATNEKCPLRNTTGEAAAAAAAAAAAVFYRLRFCRLLYQLLMNFNTFSEKTLTNATNDLKKLLAEISHTIVLGSDFSLKSLEALFDQRLMPPSFPRSIKLKSRHESYDFFHQLITNIQFIAKFNSQSDFNEYFKFFGNFSEKTPCLLSRSILHLMHLNPKILLLDQQQQQQQQQQEQQPQQLPITRTRDEQILQFLNPPININVFINDQQVLTYTNNFLVRCYHVFVFLLQICGHNRARQRDKLAKILDDFNLLRKEADSVDLFLQCTYQSKKNHGHGHGHHHHHHHHHYTNNDLMKQLNPCFAVWILDKLLKLMLMHTLSGFELDLYSVHEYHYFYGYLYEYLYPWIISTALRLSRLFSENDSFMNAMATTAAAAAAAATAGTGTTTAHKKPKRNNRKRDAIKLYHEQKILYCHALQQLCGGFHKVFVAFLVFKQKSYLKEPESWFDNERVRFERRFEPFRILQTPPPINFDEYQTIVDESLRHLLNIDENKIDAKLQNLTISEPSSSATATASSSSTNTKPLFCCDSLTIQLRILHESIRNFVTARGHLEKLSDQNEEIESLIKVAKMNTIVLKVIESGHKKDNIRLNFEFKLSKYFPTFRI